VCRRGRWCGRMKVAMTRFYAGGCRNHPARRSRPASHKAANGYISPPCSGTPKPHVVKGRAQTYPGIPYSPELPRYPVSPADADAPGSVLGSAGTCHSLIRCHIRAIYSSDRRSRAGRCTSRGGGIASALRRRARAVHRGPAYQPVSRSRASRPGRGRRAHWAEASLLRHDRAGRRLGRVSDSAMTTISRYVHLFIV
jgi:hypothetical protein